MIHDPNRRFTYITNEISLRRKLWPLFMILYIYYIVWAKREAQVFFVNRSPRARQEAKKLNQPPWVTRVARGGLRIGIYHLGQPMTKRSINLAPSRVKREAWGVLVNGIESTKISCCENTIAICLTNFKLILIKNFDLFLKINKYSWLRYELKINKLIMNIIIKLLIFSNWSIDQYSLSFSLYSRLWVNWGSLSLLLGVVG